MRGVDGWRDTTIGERYIKTVSLLLGESFPPVESFSTMESVGNEEQAPGALNGLLQPAGVCTSRLAVTTRDGLEGKEARDKLTKVLCEARDAS
jgi:hypothetical protein